MNMTKENKRLYYIIIGCSLVALITLFFARRVVTPFFIAFAFAYLLDPIVDRLEKFKISRGLSVVLLMFIF